ncbi:MAG TPA: peptidoglycan-binding protein, partial [Rhizobiales bacterium]|nr:peptidoglycan-binding protein [Hyphomicrobiales bacterium]
MLALPAAHAQDPVTAQPLVNLGDALVTGHSGVRESDSKLLLIDPDGASLRGFDLSDPSAAGPLGQPLAPEFLSVPAREIGQVFGIALDDATDPSTRLPAPNIYATATSAYGLPIVEPGKDGGAAPRRLISGAAGARWMEGLFGKDKGGGPGSVWKIDGITGEVTLFADITHDGKPNSGAALGNIAFDRQTRQFFVSDRGTGLIHRLDLTGKQAEEFDHGVAGRTATGLEAVPLDADNRADITSKAFRTDDPSTWGLADPRRRVWGLAVHDGRLYYAVAEGPQIWSVGLKSDGGFDAASVRRELDLPGDAEPHEVADIAFTRTGMMILAQRPPASGAADFRRLVKKGAARVLRYQLESPDDPNTRSRWDLAPREYAVGLTGDHRSATGGVALGYGYGQSGAIDRNACQGTVWATGDGLRENPLKTVKLQDEPREGMADGFQGMPVDMVRPGNVPPAGSFVINYDGQYPQTKESGHAGDIEIATRCPGESGAEPGEPGIAPPGVTPPGAPGEPPGPPLPQEADLSIGKKLTGPCQQGQDCPFEIAVTNLGPADYKGPLILSDTLSVPGVTLAANAPGPWNCQQAGGQITCTRPTLLLKAGHSISLPLTLRDPGNPNVKSWENCAAISWLAQGSKEPDTVRAVQTVLAGLGYYTGPIDGVAGSGTRKAIRALEKASGLPETGKITPEFLEWMFGPGSSTATDPNPGNDRACVTVPVQQLTLPGGGDFDLAVEKGPSHPAITVLNCKVDALCKFRVTVTNKGPQSYTGPIIIKDQLLPGFTLVGWTGPSICQQQGNVFSCGLVPQVTLAPGQSKIWDFELKLPASAPSSVKYIENCAEIDWKSGPGDTNKANDRGCTTIVVAPGPPELKIKKTGPKQCERGKDCLYKITVKNIGKSAHEGPVSIEDRNFKAKGIKLSSYAPKPPWTCTQITLGKYRCDHPARTLKPGDSLPVLNLKVFIPKSLEDKIDELRNCAAITQGQGKISPESCINTPIKPEWDLSIRKSGPDICYPEAQGRCRYDIHVFNSGKVEYRGPVTVVESNIIKSVKLRSLTAPPWKCSDGKGAGNITCKHPYVVLKPNQSLGVLKIEVDLHETVPPGVTALPDCATVFSGNRTSDANPKNDRSCVTTPLHRGRADVTGVVNPKVILAILFPINCIVVDIAGMVKGKPTGASHLGCTDYEFVITNKGKAAYDQPMTLRVEIPPGSKLKSTRGKISAPACSANGWSSAKSGNEITYRPSACKLAPGEKVSIVTDVSLMGGSRPYIPPEGLPKTVCGELEWFVPSGAGDIEQGGRRRISRACGTTRILLSSKPELADLQVSTAPQGVCKRGQRCLVGMSVANVGNKDFSDRIELQGQVTPPVSIRAIRAVQRGWTCRTTGGGRYTCRRKPAKFAKGGLAQIQLSLAIPRNFRG